MNKKFEITPEGEISDGYHTFAELYDHRCLLFLIHAMRFPNEFVWKPDYEGWFCLYWESKAGQISYHLPMKFLPLLQKYIRRDDNHKWDGHTSKDVVLRLLALVGPNAPVEAN